MPAMMGADLSHLGAAARWRAPWTVRGHWRMRAIAGVQHKPIGVRD